MQWHGPQTQPSIHGMAPSLLPQSAHQAEELRGVADEVSHFPGPREEHGLAQPPPLPVHAATAGRAVQVGGLRGGAVA